MLILTRKVGQTIVINDDIKIYVVSVKGNQVRIGITAPLDVSVHRLEVYSRICQKKINQANDKKYQINAEG